MALEKIVKRLKDKAWSESFAWLYKTDGQAVQRQSFKRVLFVAQGENQAVRRQSFMTQEDNEADQRQSSRGSFP
jgi:hypothetical protein